MNPDVTEAIRRLEGAGTLTPAQAGLFGRVARRELVSIYGELRVLAYAGVLLVMAGVGLLIKENLDSIGPLGIAAGLGLGSALCLAWVARWTPAFTRGEVTAPHPAFDYVLLLGALLLAADLAWIEWRFTPLGQSWPFHLLIVSLIYGALAFRCDSRVMLSLALSTFAAWRGVSAASLGHVLWGYSGTEEIVRANAAVCGVLFIALGWVLRDRAFKAHFEPVAVHVGWLLLLASPFSGLLGDHGRAYGLALTLLGSVLVAIALRGRRFSLLAMGIVGTYAGISALVLQTVAREFDALGVYWFAFTSLVVLALLFFAHDHLKEPE